jgi:hypothetical protein
MMHKLQEQYKDQFSSPKDVFEIFIKTLMSGNTEELKQKFGKDILERLESPNDSTSFGH